MYAKQFAIRFPFIFASIVLSILIAIQIIKILEVNEGHLTYTLDDPYIHLALAENLINGHYGLNTGEFSSPSSSILWPFLLAPFSRFELFPLLINIASAFVTIYFFSLILVKTYKLDNPRVAVFITTIILFLTIFATGIIWLIFTGMEHSLQVCLVTILAWGMVVYVTEKKIKLPFMIAIIIAPLIRYENLAISLTSIFLLTIRKKYANSAILLILTTIPLMIYSSYLSSNGHPILPTSVLAKTASELNSTGFIFSVRDNILKNLGYWSTIPIVVLITVMLASVLYSKWDPNIRDLVFMALLATIAHILFGKVGSLRYEVYILVFLSILVISIVGIIVSPIVDKANSIKALTGLTLLGSVAQIFLFLPYIMLLWAIPTASNNIYSQQYQMHRFVTEYYQGPIAANDIGYISYKSDFYILDLIGLASRETLGYRLSNTDNWMEKVLIEKDIKLAIIYEEWFDNIPAEWIKIGELRCSVKKITFAYNNVAFYISDDLAKENVSALLRNFSRTLPKNSTFVFTNKLTILNRSLLFIE